MTGQDAALSRASRRAIGGRATFLRAAGYGALGAIATLVVAGVALGIFFSDTDGMAIFGPINDVTTAISLALIVPAVIAVGRLARTGGWFSALSWLTAAGMLVAGAGLILLVVGVVDLMGSFVIGGVGILPFLAWLVALAWLALRGQLLSPALGWWALALIASIALSLAAAPFVPMAVLSLTLAPVLLVALIGLLYTLGRSLVRTAEITAER
jgi:hypothetical protein